MAFINEKIDDIHIRPISLSEKENIALYYSDVVSMNSEVTDPAKKQLCLELMNLMASEEFILKLSFGRGEPQYLLPARHSVYVTAAEEYPMYDRLYELVKDEGNRIFRFGSDIYNFLNDAYAVLLPKQE